MRPSAIPRLVVEHGIAFGVATPRPRLSWQLSDAPDGWAQARYEVARSDNDGSWARQQVASAESSLVPWPFEALRSRERATVKVRAFECTGEGTAWSEPVEIEAALFEPHDWVARAITPEWPEILDGTQPPALVRREVPVETGVVAARLYLTAHGLCVAAINGQRVGADLLVPGWSAYRTRLRYQVYDVTAYLMPGMNAIGITVADGWYRGFLLPRPGLRNWYGTRLAALAQLELNYVDGRREVIGTDESWRAAEGPLRTADLYMGTTYDARRERDVDGWDRPGFDDTGWSACHVGDRDRTTLVRQSSPPVRHIEQVKPIAISTSPSGKRLVDFGQNLVGRLRLSGLSADPGTEVVLRHAEVLQDGELCTTPLRGAKSTDVYIADGKRDVTWEPEFTFHGFRYADVTGWPDVTERDLAAQVIHSNMRRSGWFSCSEPLLNQLHENAVWSMRGNFVDVPTDCPQRDERLGWTGDLQVFAPSACFLYDCAGFLDSWLADLAADQDPSGGVPIVVPNPMSALYVTGTAAAWCDAATIVPWVMYERFGDRDLLVRQYPSMTAFIEAVMNEHGPELNDELYQFGDWVDPAAPPDRPGDGPTEKLLVAGAYLVRSLDIVTTTAQLIGDAARADRYRDLATHYRDVWRRRFQLSGGRLSSDTVTAYAVAICFRLLEERWETVAAGERIAALCEESGYRITTGFVGTPLVCDALTSTGHLDTAYRLLLERGCPSWLYPVTQGATTIWERWDSLLPDGRVNPSEMTSFNHYALGAIVDWMHRTIGGLAPLDPGYKTVLVRPRPGGGLTWAKTRHDSPYGETAIEWRLDGQEFSCQVMVPAGAAADLQLPIDGWTARRVTSGCHAFSGPVGGGRKC